MRDDDFDFDSLPQEEKEVILSQTKIVDAAFKFLREFYTNSDLEACWDLMDPTFKLCWAQWWIEANGRVLKIQGYDLPILANALVEEGSNHEVWDDFQRVVLRDFRSAVPLDMEQAGIGSAPRVVAQDVQLLYVHETVPEKGAWQPGEASFAVPVVMRYIDSDWKVLNFGYDQIPEPGWPPKFG